MKLNGLTWEEVEESRLKYGMNQIKLPPRSLRRHRLRSLFEITQLLILATMMTLSMGTILGVTRWTTGLGWQLLLGTLFLILARKRYLDRSEEIEDIQTRVTIYRDGREIELDRQELVVGDWVKVKAGQEVPADGLLIHGQLQVGLGMLDSQREELMTKNALEEVEILESFKWNIPITEQTLIDDFSLFKGMIVEQGEGILYVKRVGMNTLLGTLSIKG